MEQSKFIDFDSMAKEFMIELDEIILLHKIYIEETEQHIDEMEKLISLGQNWETTERLAHSIKGASGTLKMTEMYERAKELDDLIRSNIYDNVEENMMVLRTLFQRQKEIILDNIKSRGFN